MSRARDPYIPNAATNDSGDAEPCRHDRAVTPEDRYTEFVCLDCGLRGRVLPGGVRVVGR